MQGNQYIPTFQSSESKFGDSDSYDFYNSKGSHIYFKTELGDKFNNIRPYIISTNISDRIQYISNLNIIGTKLVSTYEYGIFKLLHFLIYSFFGSSTPKKRTS